MLLGRVVIVYNVEVGSMRLHSLVWIEWQQVVDEHLDQIEDPSNELCIRLC